MTRRCCRIYAQRGPTTMSIQKTPTGQRCRHGFDRCPSCHPPSPPAPDAPTKPRKRTSRAKKASSKE